MHLYQTLTYVLSRIRASLRDDDFSSCRLLQIGKRGVVYNVTLNCILGALTRSSHVPHGLGVWLLTTSELCLLNQPPPLLRLTVVVVWSALSLLKPASDSSVNVDLKSEVRYDN